MFSDVKRLYRKYVSVCVTIAAAFWSDVRCCSVRVLHLCGLHMLYSCTYSCTTFQIYCYDQIWTACHAHDEPGV